MLATGFVYSVLLCANSFGINFDHSIALPGNRSFIQTERCELRYDKGIEWSQGYVEADFHIENSDSQYVNDIKIKAVISIKKCNVAEIDINVEPKNNISLEWLKNEMIPVVSRGIQSAFQKQINIAMEYVPSFRKACK